MSGEYLTPEPENGAVRIPPNRSLKLNQFLQRLLVVASAYFLLVISTVGQPLIALIAVFLLTAYSTLSLYSLLGWLQSWGTDALWADTEGITDASGAVPGGLVRWDEISGIAESTVDGETVLVLNLHDAQAYLQRLPEMKRAMLAGSVKIYGTPCVVAQNDIGVPLGEAKQLLEDARQRFAAVSAIRQSSSGIATAPTAHWWTAVPPEERKVQPLRSGMGISDDQ